MAGKYFKLISTFTAFCPLFILYGLKEYTQHDNLYWLALVLIGIAGIGLHYHPVHNTLKTLPDVDLHITEVTPADHKLLTYVAGYFIPILTGDFLSGWNLFIIAGLLFIIIARSNASAYNPLYFFWGFKYFDIKDAQTINKTIVSNKDIRQTEEPIQVKQLGTYHFIKY